MKKLFTATSLVTGGRSGDVYIGEERLHLQTRPAHSKREGTDPEELFAAGYGACFLSALGAVGQQLGADTNKAEARAEVSLYAAGETDYRLGVVLHVYIPNQSEEKARELLELAHQTCPYSKAILGNVEVELVLEKEPIL